MPTEPAWYVLIYFVLPLWVSAAFADYLCHRASDIEHTSGLVESALHWLLFAEAGAAIIAALFFKVNALVILFIVLCIIAHEITVNIDLRVAIKTRVISPFEQQVHGVLEMVPVTAAVLLCIMHWPETVALFGFGDRPADFSLTLKEPPDWSELVWPAAGFLVFGILPYAEEVWRGWRAKGR